MKTPKVLPFRPEHLERMSFQPQQEWLSDYIKENPEHAEDMAVDHKSFSVEYEGDILFVGGCVELHKGVGEIWAVLSEDAIRRQGLFITKGAKDFLDMLQLEEGYHRLFATVDTGFVAGHRWARILGFHLESILEKYRPNKRDAALYVRLS